jgi:hypothetical protein
MAAPLFFETDPVTRSMTRITQDALTGLTLIQRAQDYRPIVEFNKRLAGLFDRHQARALAVKSVGGRYVANIPNQEFFKLLRLGITRDRTAFRRWLSRRDTRHFRTDDGSRLA